MVNAVRNLKMLLFPTKGLRLRIGPIRFPKIPAAVRVNLSVHKPLTVRKYALVQMVTT